MRTIDTRTVITVIQEDVTIAIDQFLQDTTCAQCHQGWVIADFSMMAIMEVFGTEWAIE